MSKMDSKIDLNLFKPFVLMIELKSLKQVGDKVDKGESAISKQLYRLSSQLGYPLFERGESGLEPTPMALELYPKAKKALMTFDDALSSDTFSAQEHTKLIKVAVTLSLIDVYGCRILRGLQLIFPKAPIEVVTWGKTTEQLLAQEAITIGIHFFNEKSSASFYQKRLVRDELVIVVGRNQPTPTFKEVIKWPFIAIKSTGRNDNRYPFVEQLETHGFSISFAGSVESTPAALEYSRAPGIACVSLASIVTENHRVIPLPVKLKMPMSLVTYVKVSHRQSPLVLALTACLNSIFRTN